MTYITFYIQISSISSKRACGYKSSCRKGFGGTSFWKQGKWQLKDEKSVRPWRSNFVIKEVVKLLCAIIKTKQNEWHNETKESKK